MDTPVEQHYSRNRLFETIISLLEKSGISKNSITPADLSMMDEFHVRGAEVTKQLAAKANLEKNMKVLDVGSGIGGPARFMADEYGCLTTGIDITSEYIRTAILLSELTGLGDRTRFVQGDALSLPFEDSSFDIVWTQHVQMNIEEKERFYSEIYRVLKPGGKFIYYDIFSLNNQPLHFPLPWAETSELNHLITTDDLHQLHRSTGFEIIETMDQTGPGIDFLSTVLQKSAVNGFPAASIRVLMGDSVEEKLSNLHKNLFEGKICLESGICIKSK
jgi:SAM-dependent methyltransferase